jgi:hypothetical protein
VGAERSRRRPLMAEDVDLRHEGGLCGGKLIEIWGSSRRGCGWSREEPPRVGEPRLASPPSDGGGR